MSLLSALTNFGTSSATTVEESAPTSWFTSLFPVAHAEDDGDDEEKSGDDGDDAGDDEEEEEEEEDEDEDEDEPEDIYEACEKSAPCASARHHFEECQERVTKGDVQFPNEDCTEEFCTSRGYAAYTNTSPHCSLRARVHRAEAVPQAGIVASALPSTIR
ncbi:hypothetical protein CBS9595_002726 [Malassezia furfur]|nr:hypothetical protein CBS9595_002726 [Malassezia furfur]